MLDPWRLVTHLHNVRCNDTGNTWGHLCTLVLSFIPRKRSQETEWWAHLSSTYWIVCLLNTGYSDMSFDRCLLKWTNENNWLYFLLVVKFKISKAKSIVGESELDSIFIQTFPVRLVVIWMNVAFSYCDIMDQIGYNEEFKSLDDLHNLVNWCFPSDHCSRSHARLHSPTRLNVTEQRKFWSSLCTHCSLIEAPQSRVVEGNFEAERQELSALGPR